MTTTLLFTIMPNEKNSQCVSIFEWISKLYYIPMKKYYSEIKRNEQSNYKKYIDEPKMNIKLIK